MKKCPYWNNSQLSVASKVRTFKELGQISLAVLNNFPVNEYGKITQVCGPVSTGGFDSVKLNFLILSEAVRHIREGGKYIFDQTPLEVQFVRLSEEWKGVGNTSYCWPILEEVYRPLFESGHIGTLLFLPGWESSVGSCWERSQGLALKMSVQPYPQEIYERILLEHSLSN